MALPYHIYLTRDLELFTTEMDCLADTVTIEGQTFKRLTLDMFAALWQEMKIDGQGQEWVERVSRFTKLCAVVPMEWIQAARKKAGDEAPARVSGE